MSTDQIINPPNSLRLPLALENLQREPAGLQGYSDGSRPAGEHLPTRFNDDVWSLGWADGRLSSDGPAQQDPQAFFENQARLWVLQRKIDIEAERAARAHAISVLEERRAEKAATLNQVQGVISEVSKHSLRRNSLFSLMMCLALGLAGFALLFADIPLTAQLATKSLGFPDTVCVSGDGGTAQPFDQVKGCSDGLDPQQLEGNSINISVWSNFRDVILLAFALASCSFLVKLLMDSIHKEDWHSWRARALFIATVLFFMTLSILGLVRADAFHAETAVLRSEASRYEEAARIELAKPLEDRTDGEAEKAQRLARETQARAEGRSGWRVTTGFVFLTLLFPLASGILFHYAMNYWHHFNVARTAPRDLGEGYDELKVTDAELLQEQQRLAALTATARELDREALVAAIATQWAQLYSHGHTRGTETRHTFDASPSPFERALYVIQRRLA